MIYYSSGGFSGFTGLQAIKFLNQIKIFNIELSGGKYCSNQSEHLKALSICNSFIVHNYFPVPKQSFVLNLASLNKKHYTLSMNHVINSIQLASTIGSKYYSLHAGFLLDLSSDELGKSLTNRPLFDKSSSLEQFVNALKIASDVAARYNIEILVENNVLSKDTFDQFGNDVFIFSSAEDAFYIMDNTPQNVNILVDVGHLNVSASTLGFSRQDFLSTLHPWIKGYHLSDNNALADQNKPFSCDSWFWPYLIKNLEYYSIEVYTMSKRLIQEQYALAHSMLN